jgi:hypothetical protein
MAQKPCANCGEIVSSEDNYCPHCGEPLVIKDLILKDWKKSRDWKKFGAIWSGAALIASFGVLGVVGWYVFYLAAEKMERVEPKKAARIRLSPLCIASKSLNQNSSISLHQVFLRLPLPGLALTETFQYRI